jgi:hypothetical protein
MGVNAGTSSQMLAAEVLAVILPDTWTDDERARSATVLLRNVDGRLELRSLPTRDVLADRRMACGCVRRGTPILDPTSREVVGYEMEAMSATG